MSTALLAGRLTAQTDPAIFRACWAKASVGAVIGPAALAWSLQRTSATSASLMLTLEALSTGVRAWPQSIRHSRGCALQAVGVAYGRG